ncbi:hypothetical protein FNY88_06655 [Corynebacterium guaraldiae]|uniref:Uncharacterized protein n=1 Tax=Corynebacterium guaraldiae TaxID=3051103 RepID=A0ABY3CTW5_9CORY|nr:hypothetical protein [Corynebacterium guaraldiae]TRX40220.1 hypothetical protein FNY89_07295 [Corynebacterium guaraldiae]TRX48993.1 hypothetical protein FNY88_06655 [Corynebacterium guaraldiae]TRX53291.1 hypothetical protein FNY91_04830 [Corynebacterium guaraldiae]
MLVQAVKEGVAINPLAARSIFWELKTTVADPAFEKEAWISATLLRCGECGFTVGDEATLLFCPPELAPGAAKLPTSPVSEDAVLVTSLFVKPHRAAKGLEAVLLDATIMHLTSREASAVEAFGFRDARQAEELLREKPARIGLLPVETLESAGFMVVRDHPITPRLRLELPPAFDLLTAAAVEDLLARALA